LIGHIAHTFVVVKPEEANIESKREAEKDRMTRLLMTSKLLSGGIENRHINMFGQNTKELMSDILTISNDFTLLDLLTVKDS
jgi:hypothetical protein